ncbi:MAG: HAD family hydrolase [Pseudomonadota bacterium]
MTTQIKGLVFDKDGTLFDFAQTWAACTHSILVRLAETPDQLDIMGAAIGFDVASRKFAQDSIVIAHTSREVAEVLDPFVEHMSLFDILRTIDMEAARAPQVEAVPLAPFLDDLRAKGLKLGVATNDSEAPALAHLASVGVRDKFDFIAGADSGFGFKPDAGQLLAFAQKMVLDPGECVMVGDSRHDLGAGRKAGFTTVGVLTGAASSSDLADLADVIMPNIGHIPAWLSLQS